MDWSPCTGFIVFVFVIWRVLLVVHLSVDSVGGINVKFWDQKTQGRSWKHCECCLDQSVATLEVFWSSFAHKRVMQTSVANILIVKYPIVFFSTQSNSYVTEIQPPQNCRFFCFFVNGSCYCIICYKSCRTNSKISTLQPTSSRVVSKLPPFPDLFLSCINRRTSILWIHLVLRPLV